jgi:homoserine O-acetyltransferase
MTRSALNQSRQARALTTTAGPDLLEHIVTVTSERRRLRDLSLSKQSVAQPDDKSGRWSTGAWREGSPQGSRQSVDIGSLRFEAGGALPQVRVAYETWGVLNSEKNNAIMVEHALTGDSHVCGPAGDGHATAGWWEGLIGPGKPLDTDHWFIVASNVIGGCQGTTGPSSQAPDGRPWGSRFPYVTIRDQVAAEAALADHLGISVWAAVLGGSMGGMRALEWAVTYPERVRQCIVVACSAYASAEQIAWCQPQLLAIRSDPDFAGGDYYDRAQGPDMGLGLARRIAHVTYRSEPELHSRFGRDAQGDEEPIGGGGRYAVESYLDHHAETLIARFDANSYVVLTESMNSHDVGRGRGGVQAALARVKADLVVVAVDSDRCYPPRLSHEMSQAAACSGPTRIIASDHGHDGFLTEIGQVGKIVRESLSSLSRAEKPRTH